MNLLTVTSEKLTLVSNVKVKIDKAIADAKATLAKIDIGKVDIGAELQAISDIIIGTSTAVPPPWGTYAGIGGTLIGVIGTWFGNKKNDLAKQKTEALDKKDNILVDVVKSIDRATSVLGESDKKAFITALGDGQGTPTGPTRTAVRKIRKA